MSGELDWLNSALLVVQAGGRQPSAGARRAPALAHVRQSKAEDPSSRTGGVVAVDGMAPPCFAGAGASGYLRRPGAPGLLLLAVVVVAAQVLGFFGSRLAERLPAVNPLYDLPSFADRLGELVREDIRQLLIYLSSARAR